MQRTLCFVLAIIVGTLFAPPALSQSPDDVVTIGTWRSIRSEILDEDRRIIVSTPDEYDTNKRRRFPVVYLLDGMSSFHHTVGTTRHLAARGFMPPVIIVAIANTERQRDFSPPTTNQEILNGFPEAGGAVNFLNFITSELMPHIESEYRTAPFRVLHGHSFGGLFATYVLFNASNTFDGYISISPSFQWDDGIMIQEAGRFLEAQPNCDRVFCMTIADEDGVLISRFEEFKAVLEEEAPDTFRWSSMEYGFEDHNSTTLPSTYWAMKQIFSDFRSPNAFGFRDFEEIVLHYSMLTHKYGTTINPPEATINALGYDYLRRGEHAMALTVFEHNVQHYPDSANVYDSYAECLENMNRLDDAMKNYQKAIEVAEATGEGNAGVYRRNLRQLMELLNDN